MNIASGSKRRRSFAAMARNPSYCAPKAGDFLRPPPFVKPQAPALPTEQRALLDAVLLNPEDDQPRRQYANWLAEKGNDERAKFIHDQLNGLEARPNLKWAVEFEPWCARDLVWRRGFVEGMSLAGRAFISLGEPLFKMTPLQEVRLIAVAPYFRELLVSPLLLKLRRVDFCGNHFGKDHINQLTSTLNHLDVQA